MDFIDLNAEDLDAPEPAAAPPPAGAGATEILEIRLEDLDVAPLPPSTAGPAGYPPAGVPLGKPLGGGALALGRMAAWSILNMALAGALGGFLAWAFNEPFINDAERRGGDLVSVLVAMAGFGAILGGLIGAALGSVDGLSSRSSERALRGALMGLGIGGLGGALGGVVGQLAYVMLGGGHGGVGQQIVVRAFAWAVVGLFVGIGQGAHTASARKLVNGLIGGLLGGFLGGLLFDPLSLLVGGLVGGGGAHGGLLSRLVGMTVLGLCTGAAIGLVEELRKEAWLRVESGPLVGKQFILYLPLTSLGSSPKADLYLAKDPSLLPLHAYLHQTGQEHLLLPAEGAVVAVNGRPVSRARLASGDVITLGQTHLRYQLRVASPEPRA